MGSCGRVEVVYCDPGELFSRFPDKRVAGLLLDGNDIYRSELPDSAFIVMGNEGNGISGAVREKVTSPLLIPSFASGGDTAESLNVSIATAITLSEFRRR